MRDLYHSTRRPPNHHCGLASEATLELSGAIPRLRAFIIAVSELTKWQEWTLAMERSLEAVQRSRKLLSDSFYPFDPHRPCEPARRGTKTDERSNDRDLKQ